MSFNAVRRNMKRAAAVMAEEKIKKNLEEVSGWSGSDDSSESTVCHRLSDFDDLPVNKRKKTRQKTTTFKEGAEKPTDFKASFSEEISKKHSNKPETSANAKELIDSESTTTELFSDSSSDGAFSEHVVVEYIDYKQERKQRRAQARQQHSNQPMVLSRRLAYRLSDPGLSPMFSPIAAIKLMFPPALQRQESGKAKARSAH